MAEFGCLYSEVLLTRNAWEKRKLGELAKVRTGKAFKSSSFSPNGKYYVVTNKDIGGPQISTHMDGDRIDITNPVDIAKYSLSGRNLLVTMDGVNIGKTAMYSNEDAVLAQRVGRLTSSSLDFVHQITSQKNFLTRMNELSVGNAIKHISLKQISDYAVNVPQQTSERQLIGQTLSLLDNLIAATQRRINALEEIKEASSQYLFVQEWNFRGYSSPWKQVKLGEIADIIGGGTPKTDEPKFWNGEIDWYAPAEIGSNRYVSGSVRTITSVGLNKSSASILPANRTILFTSRAGIGNAAILKKDAATNQGFQSLVLKDGVDVYFMYSKIPEIKQKAIRIAAGSTFLEISGKKLSQIALLVPELNEQQRICAFFKKLDDLIAANHSKVSRLNLLKRFLLQGLFI